MWKYRADKGLLWCGWRGVRDGGAVAFKGPTNAYEQLFPNTYRCLHQVLQSPRLAVVTALLRYGASLDRCFRGETLESLLDITVRTGPAATSAENGDVDTEELPAISALVAGVRRAGSFKRYVRAQAGRGACTSRPRDAGLPCAKRTRRTRTTQQWKLAVAFLARQGDNGVVWNVLSFWRETK